MTSAFKNAEKEAAQGSQDFLYPYKAGERDWDKLYRTTGSGVFIHEALKKEICLYGEAAQATYDTVDLQEWSRFRYESRFYPAALLNKEHLIEESHFAELPEADYTADPGDQRVPSYTPVRENGSPETEEEKTAENLYLTYLHASEHAKIIRDELRHEPGQSVAADKKNHTEEKGVWIGYVAYSPKRQDILVAWRGTHEPAEWLADARLLQIPYTPRRKRGFFGTLLKVLTPPFTRIGCGLAAVAFTLFSTVAVAPLALVYGLTSAPTSAMTSSVQEHPGPWGKVKGFVAHLAARAGATLGRCAKLGVFLLAVYGVEKAFPSALDLLGLLLTLPFAFVASIPVVEVLTPPRLADFLGNNVAKLLGQTPGAFLPYQIYVGLVAIASVWLHASPPGFLHGFWATPPGISLSLFSASVILPVALAAVFRAGAAAGEVDQATGGDEIRIHKGFHELYTHPEPEDDSPDSPKTTLYRRIRYLMENHPVKTISVTGHSLGGALAVLSSFDLAKQELNRSVQTGEFVPVTCYSFEGPRVGNIAFQKEYERLKYPNRLTAIRLVNKPDIVPALPKAFFLQNVYYILGAVLNKDSICAAVDSVEWLGHKLKFPTSFIHVGSEILVDSRIVKWLRKMDGSNPLSNKDLISPYHNLESSLHVLSGYGPSGFGRRFTRDFALVNKSGNNLNPRFGIAPNWIETLVKDVGSAGPVPARTQNGGPPVAVDEPVEAGSGDSCTEHFDHFLKTYPHLEDAYRHEDAPKPAIVQPYAATDPEPNEGADMVRVVGQGPQDDYGRNQWLEDIHSWTPKAFGERYGLKKDVEAEPKKQVASKGIARPGNVVGHSTIRGYQLV